MERIPFSIGLYPTEPATETVEQARLAETLGYGGVWVADSHMIWREMYVLLGAMAAITTTLKLGSGVTHPYVRHFSVIASGFTTLAELAPHRARIGIGIGDSGPTNIGVRRATIAELAEIIASLKQLMRGETLTIDGKEMKIPYATGHQIPIYVGSANQRMQQLAGSAADGALLGTESVDLQGKIATVREAATAAGRPETPRTIYWVPCCISEDGNAAREAVKPNVARRALLVLGRRLRLGTIQDPSEKEAVERLGREYDFYHHMAEHHSHLVLDRWVDEFSIAGTPQQVRTKVEEIMSAGVDEIAIIPFGDKQSVIRLFGEHVVKPLGAVN